MKTWLFPALGALVFVACSKSTPEPTADTVASPTLAAAAQSERPQAAAVAAASTPLATSQRAALLDPSKANEKAPATFKAKFTTSKGDFVVEVHRDWAPNAADRFYNLVNLGFFDDERFFRAVEGFMVQFGISGDPAVSARWQGQNIPDDPVTQSNKRGFVTFAQTSMPNSRSTQIFINTTDNGRLDSMRFAPFGQIASGMQTVDSLYNGYGEAPSQNQMRIQSQGNAYLDSQFPKLDSIKHAEIIR
jgi:peptidyl-prolyl cis-trans isomerase A (cyclophilin A)